MAFGLKPMDCDKSYDELCIVDAADSTILGLNDPVVLDTTTGMDRVAGQKYAKTVTRASGADGNAIYGVVIGIDQVSVENTGFDISRRHRPASTKMYVTVRRARSGARFLVEPSAALALTDVGSVASLSTATDADTTSGISTMKLDQATVDASGSATAQLRILEIVEDLKDPTAVIATDITPVVVEINNIEAFEGHVGL